MQHKSTKQIIRKFLGPTLQLVGYSTGLMRLTSLIQKIDGAMILMYHSVASDSDSKWIDPANHVPTDIFARQMKYLSNKRKVISLDELVKLLLQGKTPQKKTVVITFDDGYLDNLTIAAPILDYYRLPATLFLPSGYIDRGENQWIDQAFCAFKFRRNHTLDLIADLSVFFNLNSLKDSKIAYATVCKELLTATAKKRKILISNLFEQLQPIEHPPRLIMDWNDVRKLLTAHKCFQIGGHTMEHTDLTGVSFQEAEAELIGCIKRIEAELGFQPKYFSFCYGRTSTKLQILAAKSGFEGACGEENLDPVIRSSGDPLRLPRIAAPSTMQGFNLFTNSLNTGFWRKLH